MSPIKFLTLPIFILSLVSCVAPTVKIDYPDQVNWLDYQSKQNQLQSWTIKGRMSVQTEYEGGQLDYSWQQHDQDNYEIGLRLPLGAGTTIIRGSKNHVSIKVPSGDVYTDTDVDRLVMRLKGWPLPVSGLQYWVRGLPTPSAPYEVNEWGELALPKVIFQDGWRVEFRRYQDKTGNIFLSKLFLSRLEGQDEEEIDVRLIIRQWIINGPQENGVKEKGSQKNGVKGNGVKENEAKENKSKGNEPKKNEQVRAEKT